MLPLERIHGSGCGNGVTLVPFTLAVQVDDTAPTACGAVEGVEYACP